MTSLEKVPLGYFLLLSVAIILGIIFFVPWTPYRVLYVAMVIAILLALGIARFIVWHNAHPEEDKYCSDLDLELDGIQTQQIKGRDE